MQLTKLESELRGEEPREKQAKMDITYQYLRAPEAGHHPKHRSAPDNISSFNNKLNKKS